MGRLPLSGSKMKKIKYGTTVLETTPKKIDELREAIALVRSKITDFPIKDGNYRD